MADQTYRVPTFFIAPRREDISKIMLNLNLLVGHSHEVIQINKTDGGFEVWYYARADQIGIVEQDGTGDRS